MRFRKLAAISVLTMILAFTGIGGVGQAAENQAAEAQIVVLLKDGSQAIYTVPIDPNEIDTVVVGASTVRLAGADGVIALVGEEPITKESFYNELTRLAGGEVLSQLIAETVIRNAARVAGISVSTERINAEFDAVKNEVGPGFKDLLAQYGMTEDDLRRNIEVSLLAFEVSTKDIVITDAEVENFYKTNLDKFRTEEQVRASHILVKTAEEAQAVIAELEQGKAFDDVAAERSIDTGSAVVGGDLGFFQRGDMVQEFEDAAFSLEVGKTSDIVKTDYGYHVILVTERIDSKPISLEEAREFIVRKIKEQQAPTVADLVSDLMATTPVMVFDKRFSALGNMPTP